MPTNSFHEVARKVVASGTNVFATGLVLIIGVVIGRQMLDWWLASSRDGSSAGNPTTLVHSNGGADYQWLEFGDTSATMRRFEFEGTREEAVAALRGACKEIVATGSSVRSSSPSVAKWLDRMAGQPPVESNPGKWLLYELQHPLPMVAIVNDVPIAFAEQSGDFESSNRGVLCWGLAFSVLEQSSAARWTMFVFSPTAAGTVSQKREQLALASSCHRLLSIASDTNTVVGFKSDATPATLAIHWDAVQAGKRQATAEWQTNGNAWHRRYVGVSGETVDVQFAVESNGGVLGFCLLSPANQKSEIRNQKSIQTSIP